MTTEESTATPQTRYRILVKEPDDPAGTLWRLIGSQDASNRDQALRKQYDSPPDQELIAVAVSESSFRPQIVKSRTTTSLSEVDLPDPSTDSTTPATPTAVPDPVEEAFAI